MAQICPAGVFESRIPTATYTTPLRPAANRETSALLTITLTASAARQTAAMLLSRFLPNTSGIRRDKEKAVELHVNLQCFIPPPLISMAISGT